MKVNIVDEFKIVYENLEGVVGSNDVGGVAALLVIAKVIQEGQLDLNNVHFDKLSNYPKYQGSNGGNIEGHAIAGGNGIK